MTENPFELQGKTILVTGASSGIGREVAITVAKFGASLIITGRNAERLSEVFSSLNKANSQHHFQIIAELTSDEDIQNLVTSIPNLDGVVNCAGINDKSLLKFIDRSKIERMFNINYFGPVLLIKELVKRRKLNTHSSIVFISSISSFYATITNALYASSKGAINSLIRVLALELSNKQIRVNGIMPGMVKTDMINAYGLSGEEMDKVVSSYPLGRLGDPSDIANAVVYYLSDASSWVTGTNLVVDGGVTLR